MLPAPAAVSHLTRVTRLSVGSLVCGLVALPLCAVPVASMVLAVAGLTCGIVGHDATRSDLVPVRRRYARLGILASAGALVLALLVWHMTRAHPPATSYGG